MTMTSQQAFEAGTAAFNAHDFEGFADLLAEDVVCDTPGEPQRSGRQACLDSYGGWIAAFPDAHVEVDAVHCVHDGLIVEEGRFIGTHDGTLRSAGGAIPPTGRQVAVPYIHVLRFRDGKHVALGLLFDRLLMLEQLGLAPAPSATAAC
jgi:ketosteroid isomerase-like protein